MANDDRIPPPEMFVDQDDEIGMKDRELDEEAAKEPEKPDTLHAILEDWMDLDNERFNRLSRPQPADHGRLTAIRNRLRALKETA